MVLGEFDLINHYFNRDGIARADVEVTIGDDCAILNVPANHSMVVSTDTLVSGTHFLPNISPADLGYKSLAVNLSDLAACGASPAWLLLALTMPTVEENWLQVFSDNLFALLDQYQMQLVGGDTTKGPLSLSLTVHGLIPHGKALKRSGALPGDLIYVSGTLGDSAAGLAILMGNLPIADEQDKNYLLQRHLRPTARVELGIALRDIASSAIDLSDGLSSDLQHIISQSGCGAKVCIQALPFSPQLLKNTAKMQRYSYALAGGEDYELCFTVAPHKQYWVEEYALMSGLRLTQIGTITAQTGKLTYYDNSDGDITLSIRGYDHFEQK